jgi:hypothetical protein
MTSPIQLPTRHADAAGGTPVLNRHLTEPQLRIVALMLASEGLLTDHEIAERLEVATSDVQRWLSQRFVRP